MSQRDPEEEWLWKVGTDLKMLGKELTPGRPRVASGRFWEPRVDLIEDDRKFLIRAEISGVRADDIGLMYDPERHSIVIKGVRHEQEAGELGQGSYVQMEIPFGEFQREIKLPDTHIQSDQIRAQFRNGFLIVVIPKLGRRYIVTRTVTITKH